MTEREAISIMTAVLMTAINYDEDDGEMLDDPRERMLDAMFMAEMIWDTAEERRLTRPNREAPAAPAA